MSQVSSGRRSLLNVTYTAICGFLALYILFVAVMFFVNTESGGPGPIFVFVVLVLLGLIALWTGYNSIRRVKST